MPKPSPIHRALAKFDNSPTKLAAALSLPGKTVLRQSIEDWLRRDTIPLAHVRPVHELCDGDPAVWECRPFDWWRQWPDLVSAKGAPAVPEAANDEQKARA